MTTRDAAWLTWAAVAICAAVLTPIALDVVMPPYEAAVMTFGAGVAFSAMTPRLLRWIGRRV